METPTIDANGDFKLVALLNKRIEPGKVMNALSLSSNNTLHPSRANSIAAGEPAHRAPTTITSYMRIVRNTQLLDRFQCKMA